VKSSDQILPREILAELQTAGLVGESPLVHSLTGGVSGEIWRVEDGGQSFVVKRALPKLKVAANWQADVRRNRYEQEYLRVVGEFLPGVVPRILLADPAWDFFVMELLDGEFVDWKKALLAGRLDLDVANHAGGILGRIHGWSWGNTDLAGRFDTGNFFRDLRIAPYLLTCADKHPECASAIQAEAIRLAGTRRALVHGDFSPKNLMVAPGRLVVLDCEVAWYGDPAFDVSFLISHLLLKSLRCPREVTSFLSLINRFWRAYADAIGEEKFSQVVKDCPRLLMCLLLARVDGKSPVEYLNDDTKKKFLRDFASRYLQNPVKELSQCLSLWRDSLPS